MLARLGIWCENKELTRFEQHNELKSLAYLLLAVRNKTADFKKMTDAEGVTSLACTKYKIFSAMLQRFDKLIVNYDSEGSKEDADEEALDTIKLVKAMSDIAHDIHVNFIADLGEQRNEQKETVSQAADLTALLLTLGGGIAFSVPILLVAIGAWKLSPKASEVIKSYIGLDHPERTASVNLLNGLLKALRTANKNLCLERVLSDENNNNEKIEPKDPLICMITGEIMKDPWLCTLDGQTYEKAAILRALKENGKSPYNSVEMKDWQKPEDVLVFNRAIDDLIKVYHKEQEEQLEGSKKTKRL